MFFLLLKCRQIRIFSNSLSNRLLHQLSALQTNPQMTYIRQRSQKTNNTNFKKICVPYNVQSIGLFGFIWLQYKFISSALLASSSIVKKNIHEKLIGSTDIQNYFWQFHVSLQLKSVFEDYFPQTIFYTFTKSFFCMIERQWCAWNCRSSGITDLFHIIRKVVNIYRFIFCRKSKFYFLMANFAFLHHLFLQFQFQINTDNFYADKQQLRSVMYSPDQNHQFPWYKIPMTMCGVLFLSGFLSLKMKLSIFLPVCLHKSTVNTRNEWKPWRAWK